MSAADDWIFWSPKWQGRLKAFTLIACAAAVMSNTTADWESKSGEQHCFSSVKPGLKRMFNNLFGVPDSTGSATNPLHQAAAEQ